MFKWYLKVVMSDTTPTTTHGRTSIPNEALIVRTLKDWNKGILSVFLAPGRTFKGREGGRERMGGREGIGYKMEGGREEG